MTSRSPRGLALLGPDVILLAMEQLAASSATSGNAVLVIEHEGAIDPGRVESALARFLPTCPWIGARLERPRPWGKLRWRLPAGGPTRPPVRRASLASADGLRAVVDAELAARIDPDREAPLRVTVAGGGATSALVLTWSHPLMDPHGSEYLVALLSELDERPREPAPWSTPPLVEAPHDARPWRERTLLARRGADHSADWRRCRRFRSRPRARSPPRPRPVTAAFASTPARPPATVRDAP